MHTDWLRGYVPTLLSVEVCSTTNQLVEERK